MGRCVSCMWGSLHCNPVFVRYTAVYPSTVSLQFPSLSAAVSVFAQPTQCSLRWPVHWAGCCFVFFHVNHRSFYYSHISQEIISDMHPPFHSICTFHAVFMWRTAVPEHLNPSLLPRLPNPFLPLTFFLDLFHYYVIYRSEKYQHVLRWCKKKMQRIQLSPMCLCSIFYLGDCFLLTSVSPLVHRCVIVCCVIISSPCDVSHHCGVITTFNRCTSKWFVVPRVWVLEVCVGASPSHPQSCLAAQFHHAESGCRPASYFLQAGTRR